MPDKNYNQTYYELNKEKIKARAKAWYEAKKKDPLWVDGRNAKARERCLALRDDQDEKERNRERTRRYRRKPENRMKSIESSKAWKSKNAEKVAASQKKWRVENAERFDAYNKKTAKENWQDPEFRMKNRKRKLKKKYNLTLSKFNEIWLSQGGRCAICVVEMKPAGLHKDSVAVDHNHETGEVRGLLCQACNKGLGVFKDDPEVLMSAAQYLTKNGHYSTHKTKLEA